MRMKSSLSMAAFTSEVWSGITLEERDGETFQLEQKDGLAIQSIWMYREYHLGWPHNIGIVSEWPIKVRSSDGNVTRALARDVAICR